MTDQNAPTPDSTQAPPPPEGAGIAASAAGTVRYEAAAGTVAGAPVSSAGKRFVAYLLDGVLATVTLVIGWIIWSLVLWSKGEGQSPAKKLMKMRCVRTDTGRVASFGEMAMRELVGKWLIGSVTFGITYLVSCFMILGSSRQGVWDKVATTAVVDDPDGRLAPAA